VYWNDVETAPAQTDREDAPPAAAIRVLFVEDNADDGALLLRALERAGQPIAAEIVNDGEAALAALASREWDVVVSDYHLPDGPAGDLLQRIRALAPELPVIVISGLLDEEEAVTALRGGARDFFRKERLARLPLAIVREATEAAARREQRRSEAALVENSRRLRAMLDAVADVVWSLALPAQRFDFISPACESLFGVSAEALMADPLLWLKFVHAEDRDRQRACIRLAFTGGATSTDYRIVRPDGSVRWVNDRVRLVRDEAGQPLRVDGISSDITERKEQEERLYRASHHDELTGLANRALLADRLARALARAKRNGGEVGLLLIDLDRFREINDSLGHKAGDAMLVEAAKRIGAVLRAEDSVARAGGDEFVVILGEIADESAVARVAQKIRAALVPPMEIGTHPIHCTASIGLAVYPRDGGNAEELLKNADTAMYRAKAAGRDAVRFYAAEMNAASARRLELESELHGALERGELEVHFQPQVDLAHDGAICGFEALARWRHPQRGMVPPAEFIPIAEDSGLIGPIGDWVLREACRAARGWVEAFGADLKVAVNLSARQFGAADLAASVAAALRESRLPAKNLELEVTESLVMADADRSAATLAELKRMGIALSIDDFGTGYSSLAYLRRFPIDHIKIDRSFVNDIATDPDGAAICASIIAMAHALRLQVVAEGVETDAQLGFLRQRQCDRMQGYLFGKPVAGVEAEALLRDGRRMALPATAAAGTRERTLLLLDDEENILSALKRLLRREGYTVLATTEPEEAFALLAAHRVGVVISDQRMPRTTGTEFLRAVKGLYPDTVRMVLSGYTDLQSITDAINEGAIFRFLTKPWEDDQLRGVIREAFSQQEMSAEIVRLNRENEEAAGRLGVLNRQLEQLVAEKATRIDRDETFLGVVLEVVHRVPMPLVAVDEEGMVVLANAAALHRWPEALPGADLAACLPPAAAALLRADAGADAAPWPDVPHGRLHRRRIEVQGSSGGWLLALEAGSLGVPEAAR